jgi:hypothetical protein
VKQSVTSKVVTLYFDAESFMWLRTDFGRLEISKPVGAFTNDAVSQSENEVIIDFYCDTSDFREVDGVRLPFKFEHVITPTSRQVES